MVVTEEELRESWRNGRGELPSYPPGTRFTPAAEDFLRSRAAASPNAPAPGGAAAGAEPPGLARGRAGERELRGEKGARLVLTSRDVQGLVAEGLERGGGILRVHWSATVTDAAKGELRAAGWRILPLEDRAEAASADESPNAPCPGPRAVPAAAGAAAGAPADEELYRRVKAAVLARAPGPVDEALLDAVLRGVLARL